MEPDITTTSSHALMDWHHIALLKRNVIHLNHLHMGSCMVDAGSHQVSLQFFDTSPILMKKLRPMFLFTMISFIFYFNIETADCIWEPWSEWSTCSQSCDGGTQLRTRTLVAPERNGGECSGESFEQQDCNTEICPAGIDIIMSKYFKNG